MYSKKLTYSKKEKLCSRKVISRLFENGNTFYSDPLRILWLKSEETLSFPVQSAISVGKKSFPRAVDRNRIKRLMREAWRLNKHKLYNQLEKIRIKVVIMIIYSGKNIPEYNDLETIMNELIRKFSLHLTDISKNN